MSDLSEPPFLPPEPPSDDCESVTPAVQTLEPPAASIEIRLGYILAFVGLGAVYILMLIAGGELRNVAVAGLNAIPFTILVVLAYAAQPKAGWRKKLALGYWIILIGAIGLFALLFTIAAVVLPPLQANSQLDLEAAEAARAQFPSLEQVLRIVSATFALIAAGIISLVCFLPAVRRKAARFVDMDPQSFVHATALATVVATTLICLIPLLAVNEPPLLPLLQLDGVANLPGADEQLRTTLYSLIWAVPASFLAVGYPLRRTFREAQQRLALQWPSRLQLVSAVLIIAGLLLVMDQLDQGIELLWNARGWRGTDARAIELLFGFAAGPVGALIVSLVAGLGEELVFRGVLQPRLGILLPALMFTSVHALQYDFDALIQVLFLGLILGFVRKRTNTATSALIHGGYDFALFLTTLNG